jgi:hypothetical protein
VFLVGSGSRNRLAEEIMTDEMRIANRFGIRDRIAIKRFMIFKGSGDDFRADGTEIDPSMRIVA